MNQTEPTLEDARASGDPRTLAETLETFATAATERADLGAGAAALEEAAGLWEALGESERFGHCLLLAAAARRLGGDLGAAAHDHARAAAASLPEPMRRGLIAERAEQLLATGAAEQAYAGFTGVLETIDEPLVRAQLLQRRAAAALDAERWRDAATDLMDAEALFSGAGVHHEAEAAALGAAVAIANVDIATAEDILAAVVDHPPADGTAAARRGIVGGRIATLAGRPETALERYDAARQGALDAADSIAYLTAAAEAARAAEDADDDRTAYARLATAWVTLGDLLGEENGRALVRPLLTDLRDRLGAERFGAARAAYESR